ncbi:catechol oxidase [Salvia divinorum]|uniref:Catechol oxidase n=1 Tax=Salvia divinorum TaxID=28513 RepID=A0ABD1H8M7_SALDI
MHSSLHHQTPPPHFPTSVPKHKAEPPLSRLMQRRLRRPTKSRPPQHAARPRRPLRRIQPHSPGPRRLRQTIQPPDFKKCGVAREFNTGDLLDINCCPPVSDSGFVDYKLPRVSSPRSRPAAYNMSPEQLRKYEEAMRRMRALDKTDPDDPRGFTQQANIHCAYCNGAHDQLGYPGLDLSVHYSWIFFPFHRWYLYFFERILGSLIDDPDFALPYWNWDNDTGISI